MRFTLIFTFLFNLSFSISHAQNEQSWLSMSHQNANFEDLKTAFYQGNANLLKQYQQDLLDLGNGKITELPKGKYANLKKFMRLLEWYEPRVAESKGDMRVMGEVTARALMNAKNAFQTRGAKWKLIGPISQSASLSGNGRINTLRVDPTNPNVLYACAPGSQLFKSDNGGASWQSISDDIPSPGVTDVAIDSTAPNTLYMITGDGERANFNPFSSGLYKTTDGGVTWSTTGLSYTLPSNTTLSCIVINPKNPQIIMVGGTGGIFRSNDGGANFSRTSTVATRELVFNPHDPNIMYAGSKTGGSFLKSIDNGLTWLKITSGLPTSDVSRFSIAVSRLNPNYVFTLATNAANGMNGFFRSTDGGSSFTVMSNTPNITSNQGWYDLAIAADPTNLDIVYAGGINLYKSSNGGTTWSLSGSGVHSDVHCMTFSGTTLYTTSDGGVYKSADKAGTWTNISTNLSIGQLFSLGLSTNMENLIISGLQDNGTNLTTNAIGWRQVSAGDGMISFIDRTNDSIMYCTYQNGVLRRSVNRGESFSTIFTVPNGYWITPFMQDPQMARTLYTGGFQVYQSKNRGTNWDSISNFTGASIRWIDVDRNDTRIIYALATDKLYKTTDGGLNWANISTGLPTSGLLHVHIDVNNSNKIYVSAGSYTGNSLFLSQDGGKNWAKFTDGLPPVPTITVVTQLGAAGEIYCGTDIGVFYRDSNATKWQAFQSGMPLVPVRDLEIFYPTGKLRAATHGRGIWESPLHNFTAKCESTPTPSVSDVSITGATVSWASALGATQYTLDYKKAGAENWISLKNIHETSANLTGLTTDSVYNVRVTSVCNNMTPSSPSVIQSFIPTCTAPPTPSVTSIKPTEADIEWKTSNNVLTYQLEYKIADSTRFNTLKNIIDLGYTLRNLKMGTNYNVRLSNNCTAAASSSPSLTRDFTTVCPNTTAISVSKITSIEVLVSWQAIADISSYKLEYKLADFTLWKSISDIKETNYTLKGLVAGSNYDVRIVSNCSHVASTPTSSERFTTRTATPVSTALDIEKLSLTISPNPVTYNVNLNINAPFQGEYDVYIFSALGHTVFKQKIGLRAGENKANISMADYPKGVYFIRVGTPLLYIVKKIVTY
jgi:photosystem II stability/assembly factor-like uncharacterized protein